MRLDQIAGEIAKMWAAIRGKPQFEWGKVLSTNPLTVCTDVDPTPIPGASSIARVNPGQRVLLCKQGPRIVVIGGVAGSGAMSGVSPGPGRPVWTATGAGFGYTWNLVLPVTVPVGWSVMVQVSETNGYAAANTAVVSGNTVTCRFMSFNNATVIGAITWQLIPA